MLVRVAHEDAAAVGQTEAMSDTSAPVPPMDGAVTLFGGGQHWRPVSPALAQVRLIVLAVVLGPVAVAAVVLAVLLTPWVWLALLAVVVVAAWSAWVIVRQVSAASWVELDEELVIRRGRLFRTLVSIPYGRLQYVDLESGPLARAFGIASVEIHTASPESGGTIPGLPVAEAEALRSRLAARGEAQRAGL